MRHHSSRISVYLWPRKLNDCRDWLNSVQGLSFILPIGYSAHLAMISGIVSAGMLSSSAAFVTLLLKVVHFKSAESVKQRRSDVYPPPPSVRPSVCHKYKINLWRADWSKPNEKSQSNWGRAASPTLTQRIPIGYNGMSHIYPQNCPSLRRCQPPSHTPIPWPTLLTSLHPNGIQIQSAILPQYVRQTDRHTDTLDWRQVCTNSRLRLIATRLKTGIGGAIDLFFVQLTASSSVTHSRP